MTNIGARCFGDGDPLYEAYHDDEWGVEIRGEQDLFERVSLEAFQSGLSWITVLRKRPAFRAAFAGFDPRVVAAFDDDDVARLLADEGIVRNRAKIAATIANARAVLVLWDNGRTLSELIWSHAPEAPATESAATEAGAAEAGATEAGATGSVASVDRAATWADVPSQTDGSRALARELKAAGFKFVGPTTAYATMQACGLVDDHLATCSVVLARAGV
jgi:DNA-3-methyladenine glycosylase I